LFPILATIKIIHPSFSLCLSLLTTLPIDPLINLLGTPSLASIYDIQVFTYTSLLVTSTTFCDHLPLSHSTGCRITASHRRLATVLHQRGWHHHPSPSHLCLQGIIQNG
jgi:hypothetical protein